eukprot:TRINITY_DN1717_c0_g1_i2.p1 TRINITY_DN1717_c0_g1~~TRINITY_DN1717_c0_g1_i2.p1  ORF type:complete len:349 (+),score=56.17 TRINITY_DN1717_c0_g1_i2:129-1049(+)
MAASIVEGLNWEYIQSLYGGKSSNASYTPVPPSTFMEHSWMYLLDSLGEFGVFVFAYLLMAVLYAVGGIIFYYVDYFRLIPSFKIQNDRYATPGDYWRCIRWLIISYLLIILPLGIISFPVTRFLGLDHALPLPPVWLGTVQMLMFLFLEDFFHYWMHRFFHTPWFYKHIHKEHHYYAAPFGFSASYAHPVEVVFLGMATFAPALLIRPHYFVFYWWFIVRQLDAVITHSGYDLPSPFDIVPYFGGTPFHDFHHKAFNCNYGSRLTWVDKLFGTYRDPPTEKKEVTEIKPASMEEEMKIKNAKKSK